MIYNGKRYVRMRVEMIDMENRSDYFTLRVPNQDEIVINKFSLDASRKEILENNIESYQQEINRMKSELTYLESRAKGLS